MIDYLLEIGTRKGAYVPVSGRDVADARRNGKAWLELHRSGVRSQLPPERTLPPRRQPLPALQHGCPVRGHQPDTTVAPAWTGSVIAF